MGVIFLNCIIIVHCIGVASLGGQSGWEIFSKRIQNTARDLQNLAARGRSNHYHRDSRNHRRNMVRATSSRDAQKVAQAIPKSFPNVDNAQRSWVFYQVRAQVVGGLVSPSIRRPGGATARVLEKSELVLGALHRLRNSRYGKECK